MELELAGDPGGVNDFSAAKTRFDSASCKPVCQFGSRTMALLLLSTWAMAALFSDVSGSGTSHSDALSSEAWSADPSLSDASSCRASSSDAFDGREFS